jgi:hypothetical protein
MRFCLRNHRSGGSFESPVRTINRTFTNPFSENRDLSGAHRLGFALRVLRHQVMRVVRLNTLDQFALLRMAGHNSIRTPGALFRRILSEVQPEPRFSHFRVWAMTAEAARRKNRLNVLIEINSSASCGHHRRTVAARDQRQRERKTSRRRRLFKARPIDHLLPQAEECSQCQRTPWNPFY